MTDSVKDFFYVVLLCPYTCPCEEQTTSYFCLYSDKLEKAQCSTLDCVYSWKVHTDGRFTLKEGSHSWKVHTHGRFTLMESCLYSGKVHTHGRFTMRMLCHLADAE